MHVFLSRPFVASTPHGGRSFPAGWFGAMSDQLAVEAERLRVGRILRGGEACVRVDREYRYREGVVAERVLHAGWVGVVPGAVAAELEAAGAGRRLEPGDAPVEAGEAPGDDAPRGAPLELVRVARSFTYTLGDGRGRRTLPVNWSGYVARDVARAIEDVGAGRILRSAEAAAPDGRSRRRAHKLEEVAP